MSVGINITFGAIILLNGGIKTIFLIYVKSRKAQITRLCKAENTKRT